MLDKFKKPKNEKSHGRKPRVDTMTKEKFVSCWIKTGLIPKDEYMDKIAKYRIQWNPQEPVKKELRTLSVALKMWKIREDRKALVGILRRPKKIAECLEEHNLWRRAQGKYSDHTVEAPYSAYMIGKLIEGAVNYLNGSDTEIYL